MRTIRLRDLEDNQILDLIDPAIPYILLPNFRPHSVREWRTTDIYLNSKDKLENIDVRDLTVDIMTNKKTVEKIFRQGRFDQLAIWQFNKRLPDTLKIDELPPDSVDRILAQNGLINRIWVNYEYVELSSIDEKYLGTFKERYKDNLV